MGRPSSAFQDYIPHGRQAGSAGTLLTHSLDGWRRNRHPQMLLRAEMPALRHGMDGALSRKGPALHLYTPGNPSLRDPVQRRGQPAPAAAVSPRAISSQASRAIPQLHHVPFHRRRPRPAQLQIHLVLARALIPEQTQVPAPIQSSPADAMKPLPEALPEASPPAGIPSLLAPWASREGSGGAGRQAGKGDSLALMQKALDHTEHPCEGPQHPQQHTPVPGWALTGARMGNPTVNPPAGEPAGMRGSELAPASWLLLPCFHGLAGSRAPRAPSAARGGCLQHPAPYPSRECQQTPEHGTKPSCWRRKGRSSPSPRVTAHTGQLGPPKIQQHAQPWLPGRWFFLGVSSPPPSSRSSQARQSSAAPRRDTRWGAWMEGQAEGFGFGFFFSYPKEIASQPHTR